MNILGFTPVRSQNVPIGATSNASGAAIGVALGQVRLLSDVDCWITAGPAPVASAVTSLLLGAGSPEYFRIPAGYKIAVLQTTSSGSLNITEMTQ